MDETTPIGTAGGPVRRVLAGRYVLRGLLGQGGMADVELASDEVLGRQVAVKILHSRYAHDPAFLERFKREARAAASLNHPNLVAVYDTGEQDARPFIVMEYVAGRSLRDVLRTEGVLPQRATEIAIDAAVALHYAHARGLIHRDIKPANIMVSDEGVVKVADFGIARAVNAETVTQTAAVFGTAAYIAPEQAQGGDVDARTDIYSLGVVLYEMLTGGQPFTADSAVALAYKHVSEDPVPPGQRNPEIPPALEAVVLKAMAKNPDNRYPNARAFADDLRRAMGGQTVTAPPVMAYAPTQAITRERTVVAAPRSLPPAQDTTLTPAPDERRGSRTLGYLVLGLLILAAFAVGAFLLVRLLQPDPIVTVEVPDVTGRQLARAERILERENLQTRVERMADSDVARGVVISTNPPAGAEVDEGTFVLLLVSAGPPQVTVPRLRGLPETDAVRAIQQADLSVGVRTEQRSDDAEAGIVLSSDPAAGTRVAEGQAVDYVVAAGPATVEIPKVRGQSQEQASQTLRNACTTPPCLEITVEQVFDDDVDRGDAISTDPAAGQRVDFGDTVQLFISQGPEPEPSPSPEPTEPEPTEPEPTEPEPTEPTEPAPTEG